MNELYLRPMKQADWNRVREIYLEGIATGNATFETEAPSWNEWNARHCAHSRFVAHDENGILGWAALSSASSRRVYSGVCEVSIYIAESARGLGIGRRLLSALINSSEQHGIWTLQAGVFPENTASLKLHISLGFRRVGVREKIGRMNGTWRDTVLLERRSSTIGIQKDTPQ
jgi:L-amino acid N-acyltransferase YncA